MATLDLHAHLRADLDEAFRSLPPFFVSNLSDGDSRTAFEALAGSARAALDVLGHACRGLLSENGWVHLPSLPGPTDARAVLALGHLLGDVFRDLQQQGSIVVEARPGIGRPLQGCHTRALPLHTDFAMLPRPPALTIIACRKADPAGPTFVRNGLSDVRDILARSFGDATIEHLLGLPLPFAGRQPSGADLLLEKPIVETNPAQGGASVRFHPSRIHHGFRVRGRPPTPDEALALRTFPQLAASVRTELLLGPGDVLVLDNRRVLHDRTRSTLRLERNGGLDARLTHVLFVQELWPE